MTEPHTVRAGDRDYETLRHTYTRRGAPTEIVLARDAEDVAAVVERTGRGGGPLAVRSGGHGISGRSTLNDGVLLDLSGLHQVEVLDEATRLVRLGPGALWGDVAAELGTRGWALSSGDTGDVGVGGLATAGGMGLLARRWGLTIDRVRAVEIVLADGSLVRADDQVNPDLLWAVRGAGANFGVVTAFELAAEPVDQVAVAETVFDAHDTAGLLERWGAAVEAAPREVTSFLTVMGTGRGPIARAYTVHSAGEHADSALLRDLRPVLEVGPVLDQQVHRARYPDIVRADHAPHHAQQPLAESRSALFTHLDAETAAAVAGLVQSGAAPMTQFRSVGGAVNDLSADATAYAHRHQNFSLMAATTPDRAPELDARWPVVAAHSDGLYLSFETRVGEQQLRDAFPGAVLERLRSLKARYDPANLFDRNFALLPA